MKKHFMQFKLLLLVFLAAIFAVGCSDMKDDIDDLKKKTDEHSKELATLQDAVVGLTADIKAGKLITKVEDVKENNIDYVKITFSDGSSKLIKQGHTPIISIDASGYWCVDGVQVLVGGKPYKAQGDHGTLVTTKVVDGKIVLVFTDPNKKPGDANYTWDVPTGMFANGDGIIQSIVEHPFWYDVVIKDGSEDKLFRFAKDILAPQSVKIRTPDLYTTKGDSCYVVISVSPANALMNVIKNTNVFLDFSNTFKHITSRPTANNELNTRSINAPEFFEPSFVAPCEELLTIKDFIQKTEEIGDEIMMNKFKNAHPFWISANEGDYVLKFKISEVPYFREYCDNPDHVDNPLHFGEWEDKFPGVPQDGNIATLVADMFDVILTYPTAPTKLNEVITLANEPVEYDYTYVRSVNSIGFVGKLVDVEEGMLLLRGKDLVDHIYSNANLDGSVYVDTKVFPFDVEYIRTQILTIESVEHYNYDDAKQTSINENGLKTLFAFTQTNVDAPVAVNDSMALITWNITPDVTAMKAAAPNFKIGDYLKIKLHAVVTDERGQEATDDVFIYIRFIDPNIIATIKELKMYLPIVPSTNLYDGNFSTGLDRVAMLKEWGFPVNSKLNIKATPDYTTFPLATPTTTVANNANVTVAITEATNALKADLNYAIDLDKRAQGLLISFEADGIAVKAKLTHDVRVPGVVVKYAKPISGYAQYAPQTYAVYYLDNPINTVPTAKLLNMNFIELTPDAELPGVPIPAYTYTTTDADLLTMTGVTNTKGYVSTGKELKISGVAPSYADTKFDLTNIYAKLSSGQSLPFSNIRKDDNTMLTGNAGQVCIELRRDMLMSIVTDPVDGTTDNDKYIFTVIVAEHGKSVDQLLVSATFSSSATPINGYANIYKDLRTRRPIVMPGTQPIEFTPKGISVATNADQDLKDELQKLLDKGITNLVFFELNNGNAYMRGNPDVGTPAWRGDILQTVEIAVIDNWGNRITSTIKLPINNVN